MFLKRYLTSNLRIQNIHFIILLQYNYYFHPKYFSSCSIKNCTNCQTSHQIFSSTLREITYNSHQIETILSQTTSTRIIQLKRSQTSLIQARLYVLSTRERERENGTRPVDNIARPINFEPRETLNRVSL